MNKKDSNKSEIYFDDIEMYLQEYCKLRNIKDVYKIPSTQWVGCLMYINQNVFHTKTIMRYVHNQHNAIDLYKASVLISRYIRLCNDYNQRISIMHFSYFSGFDESMIYRWQRDVQTAYIYLDNNNAVLYSSFNEDYTGEYYRKVTIKPNILYQKLINNILENSEDLMLSRAGVNSIAYRNATQERYSTIAQQNNTGLITNDIAESLGITEQLALIESKS